MLIVDKTVTPSIYFFIIIEQWVSIKMNEYF